MKKILSLALSLLLVFGLSACGSASNNTGSVSNQVPTGNEPIKIGKVDCAPHGDKTFGFAMVVMQGDKIVGAYIDEYQFMPKANVVAVPNAEQTGDGALGSNFADPSNTVLASKRTNTDYYSDLMKKNAGSTVTIAANYEAIQDYVVGKTIVELETALKGKDAKQMVDAVSSATLVDTKGYVEALLEAAKVAQ